MRVEAESKGGCTEDGCTARTQRMGLVILDIHLTPT